MATGIAWMAEARCRDVAPELFFPSNGTGVARAKRICALCDVREACLEYALENVLDHGVWGGASERERRRILRARRLGRGDHEGWRLTRSG